MWRITLISIAFIVSSCSVFQNRKIDKEVLNVSEGVKMNYQFIDTSSVFEYTRKSIDIRIPSRVLPINVNIKTGKVDFLNSAYHLILELDSGTGKLSGAIELPESTVKGFEETGRLAKQGISETDKSKYSTEKREEKIKTEELVSWKTILGLIIIVIIIIVIAWANTKLSLK
ncbi:hypothetical protein ACR777_15085 [Sphingobacterium spiritivorum]|uniref:hypothetical protein n=1 Tax=Sphingobacterium spiritivorum TaxID=258 RepID=UPI003DA69957